ncbi:hypothetical protein [Dyadobacter luticola]|uniref:Lipoprotein n=1 Tax=Dyadobacter luticola TaxID=1979387 RepID=A0A5R9KVP6_9BACT|nr:hypothetical protein [Dyadobacter luticola]TLV00220.1 hypothetical protein FEN17_11985 [Dyadobacter luticola]
MKKILVAIFFAAILGGCDSGGRVGNTKELNKEMKATQIKRVTNTQLVYYVNEWGKKIAQIAEKSLDTQLSKDPKTADTLCRNLGNIPVIAALEKEYGVNIELLGVQDIKNPKLAPKEREILDAYLFSAKSKATAGENLQQLNDTLLVYNVPVDAESIICKECMKNDDMRFAVWRLLFSKKEIIRKLDVKQLKE